MRAIKLHIKEVLNRLFLLLVWLIIFGAISTELTPSYGILSGMLTLGFFLFYHGKLSKPENWDNGRLQLVLPKHGFLLVGLAIVLVLGDIFWLFHIKTSADDFREDTLTFIVLGIVAFPVIEEFGFRLWLQGYLERHLNKLISVLIVSMGFAMVHSADMPIPQLLSGILYGLALIVTGSIWVPVFLHMLHNAILIISGQIQMIQEISFAQMDRTDNINLYMAVLLWTLATVVMYLWWRLNDKMSLDNQTVK